MRVAGFARVFCANQGQKRRNSIAIASILDTELRIKSRKDSVPVLCGVALTPAILNDMVKAVYVHVHAPYKSSGHREQDAEISSYDMIDMLPYSFFQSLQSEETA